MKTLLLSALASGLIALGSFLYVWSLPEILPTTTSERVGNYTYHTVEFREKPWYYYLAPVPAGMGSLSCIIQAIIIACKGEKR